MRLSKGAAARTEALDNVRYTFTGKQLRERDALMREKIRRELNSEIKNRVVEEKKQIDNYIRDEWQRREDLFKGEDFADHFFLALSFLLSISCRVLVRDFGWPTMAKEGKTNSRNRLFRFANNVTDEVAQICGDDEADIRNYVDEVYKEYGVKFEWRLDQ